MLQPDALSDWGPYVREVLQHLNLWRKAVPPETLHTVTMAWAVGQRTRAEMFLIWHLSGVLDIIRQADAGVHAILEEATEEVLEEAGYDLYALPDAG